MLQSLIQNISEIVVVIDAGGVINFSSPQLEKVLGLRTEDVVGRNIFEFIHPDDTHRAQLEYSETVQKPGEGVPSTLRIRDATGQWIPLEIIANNQLDDPTIRGVIFTARDLRFRREVEQAIRSANADIEREVEQRVTELAKANGALRIENQSRRETEKRLQETISLLNATLDSTTDGILVVDKDRTVTGCNKRFFAMWHLPCDSAIGVADIDLLSAAIDQLDEPEAFASRVQALYSDPTATSFDILKFKDGRIFERYSQPQRLGESIVGRVWSFRDVTEARRLEDELRQSQKLEALGRLAGGVAHDFNNLLMLISGYLGKLSETGLSSQQAEISEHALAAAKRGATLTRQMLSFSRKRQNSATVTNLNEVVTNMQAMIRTLVSDVVCLEISLSDAPVPIFADVMQLEVVLMNLAINAQDAMPKGGKLSVATGRYEQDRTTFGVLTVTDTGRGMTPEVRARIFDPFFTTKDVGKGTGLGLSTAFAIVQRYGGHIEVESEPNKGTTFRIYLPETVEVPQTDTAVTSSVPPAHGNETILLAEDEVGIRAMTRAYLESLGYHVLEAADGLEAVNISREYRGPIHLVVTDVLMPVLRGDAVVDSIRQDRPGIKALYISGYSEDLEKDDPIELLLKPFEFPELGRRIRTTLDAHVKLNPAA